MRRPERLAAALLLVLVGCGGEPSAPPSVAARGRDAERTVLRERASALFYADELDAAMETLAPLLDTDAPAAADLVAAGNIEQSRDRMDAAAGYYRRAIEADPDSAAAHYDLGMVLAHFGQFEEALPHLAKAHALAPDDLPALLALASVTGETGDRDAARKLYDQAVAAAADADPQWRFATRNRWRSFLQLGSDDAALDRAEALVGEAREELKQLGLRPLDELAVRRGHFGYVDPPPEPGPPAPAPAAPSFDTGTGPVELAGVAHLVAATLRDDARRSAGNRSSVIGAPDLVGWGPGGIVAAERLDEGGWTVTRVLGDPVDRLWLADLDDDGGLDFLVAAGGRLSLLMSRADGWSPAAFATPADDAAPADLVVFDADFDGDPDVVLAGPDGVRLWRNDGVCVKIAGRTEGEGAFVDGTAEAELPAGGAFAWVVAEDFDLDEDLDLLLGREGAPPLLVANDRTGRFRAAGAVAGLPAGGPEPLVADLDGDRAPDLLWPGSPGRIFPGKGDGTFGAPRTLATEVPADAAILDVDLDGTADVVWRGADRALAGVLAPGTDAAEAFAAGAAAGGPVVVADLDNDYRVDAAVATDRDLHLLPGAGERRPAIRLALRGRFDNRRALGAVVEVRAGPVYRRVAWDGEPVLLGLGGRSKADVVRVRWPNGARESELDVPAGRDLLMVQSARLIGSCPFLYTFDGERTVFVTDVLGGTPLGMPMGPGKTVPFDHDEYVRIRGDQLAPRTLPDGRRVYEMHLTEELREETFLDRAKLLVVDHPAGTEMQPNERFCFPPWPEPEIHVMGRIVAPARAVGSDGSDPTAAVAAEDGDFAAPFTPLPPTLRGLARPHWTEVDFDPADVPADGRLRLLMTGWFYWSGSSVNMARARTPGVDFVPPVLQVPDGEGGWRDTGPPVGFPSGKTKTMVIDVTDLLVRDDPRVRIRTTLHLPWDAIRLAVGDSAKCEVREIEPASARVWTRGFSRPIPVPGHPELERFDWNELLLEAPWDPTPGLYTKHGEAVSLLGETDDRYIVFGAGDCVTLRFPADGPPPPDGWVRDYLLYVDGWCKDRDPNTLTSTTVEPLPFHGMSDYPPPPGESYPTDDTHTRFRREWLTR